MTRYTTMIPRDLERVIETYHKQGWYPVKWSHHPPEIKAALRAIGYRPRMKECYGNSQRLFLSDLLVGDLEYVEGHAGNMVPVQHAWLLYEGEVLDLTLDNDTMRSDLVIKYTREQVRKTLVRTECFGPVSEAASYLTNPINAGIAAHRPLTDFQLDSLCSQMREDGLHEHQLQGALHRFNAKVEEIREAHSKDHVSTMLERGEIALKAQEA